MAWRGRRRGTTHKYAAIATIVDNIWFPSQREANRYRELKLLVAAGEIDHLETQPRFPLSVNGVKLGAYVGDFKYRVAATGAVVIEDAKVTPTKTQLYRWKVKHLKAEHGITVIEV